MPISAARFVLALLVTGLPLAALAAPDGPDDARTPDMVRRRAAASVVRVVTTGYRPVAGADDAATPRVRRQHTSGSGFAIDEALIVTTSALLAGAEHIEVTLGAADGRAPQTVVATLVGLAPEVGLAVLRAEIPGLRPLAIAPPGGIARGQTVFALQSAGAGLPVASVTSVKAVALSVEPMSATAWIQTGRAIATEACGGPLVDVDGALVGLTTCPDSPAEGAGYAVPGAVVALAVPQLREFGHLHRARLGLTIEALTPEMRQGLGLGATPGVIVADVVPDGPAEASGLQVGDLLTAVGGRILSEVSMADFSQHLLALTGGQRVPLAVERAGRTGVAVVTAVVPDHHCARPVLLEIEEHVIEPLGIIGLPVGPAMAEMFPGLRTAGGVVVLWHIDGARPAGLTLARGDVIHAVNGSPVATPADVRVRLRRLSPDAPLVLQVERAGVLTYLTAPSDRR